MEILENKTDEYLCPFRKITVTTATSKNCNTVTESFGKCEPSCIARRISKSKKSSFVVCKLMDSKNKKSKTYRKFK